MHLFECSKVRWHIFYRTQRSFYRSDATMFTFTKYKWDTVYHMFTMYKFSACFAEHQRPSLSHVLSRLYVCVDCQFHSAYHENFCAYSQWHWKIGRKLYACVCVCPHVLQDGVYEEEVSEENGIRPRIAHLDLFSVRKMHCQRFIRKYRNTE